MGYQRRVMDILKTVPKSRRAWVSVDGVLVEMTAHTVLPKLYQQKSHFAKQIDDVAADVELKKTMLADFAIKEKLVVPVYKDANGKNVNPQSGQAKLGSIKE